MAKFVIFLRSVVVAVVVFLVVLVVVGPLNVVFVNF